MVLVHQAVYIVPVHFTYFKFAEFVTGDMSQAQKFWAWRGQ